MTKKDYIAISGAIADFANSCDKDHLPPLRELAGRIATTLQQDNPDFTRARFLAACFPVEK